VGNAPASTLEGRIMLWPNPPNPCKKNKIIQKIENSKMRKSQKQQNKKNQPPPLAL